MADDAARVAPWNRPDVLGALAHGDWPIVLRAFLDGGLSQTAIAARTGLSQSQISRLASGKSRTPGIKTIRPCATG
jgi:Helix-turn-helix